MDVVFDSLTSGLFWSLEERTHIHVEATVSVARSDNLCTAVVTVLTHLSDHNTGLTTFLFSELLSKSLSLDEVLIFAGF